MRALREYFQAEDGTATVEAVLILPFLLAIIMLTVDLSMIFNSRAEVLRVIQDANRNVSIGRLGDVASAKTYVETNLDELSPNATAQASIIAGVITTTVTLPASDVLVSGLFTGLLSVDMTLSAQHLIEDWEA